MIAALRACDERIAAEFPEEAVEMLSADADKGRSDYADALLAALRADGCLLVSEAELATLERTKREWIDCDCQGTHNVSYSTMFRELAKHQEEPRMNPRDEEAAMMPRGRYSENLAADPTAREHDWRDHSSSPHHHQADGEPIWDLAADPTARASVPETLTAIRGRVTRDRDARRQPLDTAPPQERALWQAREDIDALLRTLDAARATPDEAGPAEYAPKTAAGRALIRALREDDGVIAPTSFVDSAIAWIAHIEREAALAAPAPVTSAELDARLRGDGPCQDCGTPDNIVWFTDNTVWNRVMGGPGTTDDPGGIVCVTCFVKRADAAGLDPTGWQLTPEWAVPFAAARLSEGAGHDE